MSINKDIINFVYKVGIPTSFALILLYYVLNTTIAREERLMNFMEQYQKQTLSNQAVMINQHQNMDKDLTKMETTLQYIVNATKTN